MSIKLKWRKSTSKAKGRRAGTYYLEGTDHRGGRVFRSLKTGDRSLAEHEFVKEVSRLATLRKAGVSAVANFANAVAVYTTRKPTSSNLKFLRPMLGLIGAKRLADFTQADLDELAGKLIPPGRKPSYIKRAVYTPFISAWAAAADNDPPLCERRRWKSPEIPEREATEIPAEDHLEKLMAASSPALRNRDAALILTLTYTGARSGEVQRLELRDIQLGSADEIARVLYRRTKWKPRSVAMAPRLEEALRLHIADLRAKGVPEETKLFGFSDPRAIAKRMRRLHAVAGLKYYRPHVMGRHTFATRLLLQGNSPIDVARAGGWANVRMIDSVYSHIPEARIDGIVSGADKGKKDGTND